MKQFRTRKERIERILILLYGWYLIFWQVMASLGNTIWYDLRLFFVPGKQRESARRRTGFQMPKRSLPLSLLHERCGCSRILRSYGLKMLKPVGPWFMVRSPCCWSVHRPLFLGHCQWQHFGERRGARMALWSRYGTPFQSDAFEFKGGKRFRHQHRWTDTSTASHQHHLNFVWNTHTWNISHVINSIYILT